VSMDSDVRVSMLGGRLSASSVVYSECINDDVLGA